MHKVITGMREGDCQPGMNRQGRIRKENKTLSPVRREKNWYCIHKT